MSYSARALHPWLTINLHWEGFKLVLSMEHSYIILKHEDMLNEVKQIFYY